MVTTYTSRIPLTFIVIGNVPIRCQLSCRVMNIIIVMVTTCVSMLLLALAKSVIPFKLSLIHI